MHGQINKIKNSSGKVDSKQLFYLLNFKHLKDHNSNKIVNQHFIFVFPPLKFKKKK